MEVPPPFTNLQASRGGGGGGKTWQEEPGGEGGVLGLWGKFLERWGFHFQQGVYFHHLCARGWSGRPMFQLLAEMNGKRQIGESESVSYCLIVIILLFLRFGGSAVLETVLDTKVLANKCLVFWKPLEAV